MENSGSISKDGDRKGKPKSNLQYVQESRARKEAKKCAEDPEYALGKADKLILQSNARLEHPSPEKPAADSTIEEKNAYAALKKTINKRRSRYMKGLKMNQTGNEDAASVGSLGFDDSASENGSVGGGSVSSSGSSHRDVYGIPIEIFSQWTREEQTEHVNAHIREERGMWERAHSQRALAGTTEFRMLAAAIKPESANQLAQAHMPMFMNNPMLHGGQGMPLQWQSPQQPGFALQQGFAAPGNFLPVSFGRNIYQNFAPILLLIFILLFI